MGILEKLFGDKQERDIKALKTQLTKLQGEVSAVQQQNTVLSQLIGQAILLENRTDTLYKSYVANKDPTYRAALIDAIKVDCAKFKEIIQSAKRNTEVLAQGKKDIAQAETEISKVILKIQGALTSIGRYKKLLTTELAAKTTPEDQRKYVAELEQLEGKIKYEQERIQELQKTLGQQVQKIKGLAIEGNIDDDQKIVDKAMSGINADVESAYQLVAKAATRIIGYKEFLRIAQEELQGAQTGINALKPLIEQAGQHIRDMRGEIARIIVVSPIYREGKINLNARIKDLIETTTKIVIAAETNAKAGKDWEVEYLAQNLVYKDNRDTNVLKFRVKYEPVLRRNALIVLEGFDKLFKECKIIIPLIERKEKEQILQDPEHSTEPLENLYRTFQAVEGISIDIRSRLGRAVSVIDEIINPSKPGTEKARGYGLGDLRGCLYSIISMMGRETDQLTDFIASLNAYISPAKDKKK